MELIDHSRTLITITGEDAATFLQGIITQDIEAVKTAPVFSAMLSPQGKWNYDFFILKQDNGFVLDAYAPTADALIKKLSLYKLRAKVAITRLTDWRMGYAESPVAEHSFTDPRHPSLPTRIWVKGETPMPEGLLSLKHVLAVRLNLGIPTGGIDVTENETVLDVGYDLLNAVSFTKGCYVGQEVTARMHYKSISRKGFYQVTGNAPLPADATQLTIDGKKVGELRSRLDNQGLVYARFDDLEGQKTAQIGDIPVALAIPEWLQPRYDIFLKNKEA